MFDGTFNNIKDKFKSDDNGGISSFFVSLWPNLDRFRTKLLETISLICCAKRFPLVLMRI